ncbi:flagellar hook-associated protein FlgK [Magnetospirillum molischianum]|uniref:Flagellar hook-associated protein 1 n=1 Tax=Magnetospirillum molischianum DSM 120 TaxID=1150626 RepID=H8FQK7_MAGML|nr:flagellar hook-associated protein FlgK [Magnetospirillum molischianum]CCG40645.1 putative Flagellar hook-associated protein [Magnetospirillum molischianum DSM 120]
MAITLGLDTALSGLLTNQQALNTISQNIVNVNTPGYTRKVLMPESRVVNGTGAGVQITALQRNVDEGLLSYIRSDNATLSNLQTLSGTYQQVQNLFGKVGDKTSISHNVQAVLSSLVALAATPDKSDVQSAAVQAAKTMTDQMSMVTDQLQSLRATADQKLSSDCDQINSLLSNIHDLNVKITRSLALKIDATDLQDQRDQSLTSLSKLIDINYYNLQDGGVTVGTRNGDVLINSNQAFSLSHSGLSSAAPWMTRAGGQFGAITLNNGTVPAKDLTSVIADGSVKANIDLRDTILPNLQSQIDQLATQVKDTMNLVNNRGAQLPVPASTITGTRTFADQTNLNQSISLSGTEDTALVLYDAQGNQKATTTLRSLMDGSSFTPAKELLNQPWTLSSIADRMQTWMRGQTSYANASTAKVGFDATGHFSITTGNTDIGLAFHDQIDSSAGAKATDISVSFHSVTPPALSSNTVSIPKATALGTSGDTFTLTMGGPPSHVYTVPPPPATATGTDLLNWVRSIPGLEGSEFVNVGGVNKIQFANTTGLTITATGSTATMASLAPGAPATTATPDEVVQGFSNFLGLNDLFVSNQPRALLDSQIMPPGTTLGTTRDLTLYDRLGGAGPTMSFSAGTSLDTIAQKINSNSTILQSGLVAQSSITLSKGNTSINILDANGGTVSTFSLPAGTTSLQTIADSLTASNTTLTAQVEKDGNGYRLRIWDNSGNPLAVSYDGPDTTDLRNKLSLSSSQIFVASVVDEGAGQRLRIRQSSNMDVYAQSSSDAANTSILTDLGLDTAASGSAATITVRKDILSAPSKMSRAATQWNADTKAYYMSTGDANIASQMVTVFNQTQNINGAGKLATSKYSLTDYATQVVSMTSQDISSTSSDLSYHATLNSNISVQIQAKSGVNLDEEVANMINFQQAYSASAKVISTLNDMLQVLMGIIR